LTTSRFETKKEPTFAPRVEQTDGFWIQLLQGLSMLVKRFAYGLIPQSLLYRQGEKPNIIMLSSRRGGSTHLAELIATEHGMRLIDQPFDLHHPGTLETRIRSKFLPPMLMSQFIAMNNGEAERVRKYLHLILNGKLKHLSGPEFARKNRTLLKVVNALPLADWFAEEFPAHVVYLIRHPVSQGLSVVENHWGITTEAYLRNEFFVHTYLNQVQLNKGFEILNSGTYLEKAVLNWICENLVPMKHARFIDLFITYEELVLRPAEMISRIAASLGLTDVPAMQKRIKSPSVSVRFSSQSTLEAIRNSDNQFLLSKWKHSVSEEELDKIQELLDLFGIDEYNVRDILPNTRLLHFPLQQELQEAICDKVAGG
jgi:hypothetical protein